MHVSFSTGFTVKRNEGRSRTVQKDSVSASVVAAAGRGGDDMRPMDES